MGRGRQRVPRRDSGALVQNVGHDSSEIADAVATQLPNARRAPRLRRPRERAGGGIAARVADLAPSRRWRCSSAPAARRPSTRRRRIESGATGRSSGGPERTVIVSRRYAYHGTNAYGTSLSGIPAVRDGYGTLVGDVGRGGARRPGRPRARARRARSRACRGVHGRADDRPAVHSGRRGLLARGRADLPRARCPPRWRTRWISGFGRLGRSFGCERYGFTPDLMTCAKDGGQAGLRAARRRRRRRPGARAVLAQGRGALRPRRHVLGPPGRVRRGPRQPRHPRARAARRARGRP